MLGLGLTSTTHKSRATFDRIGYIFDTGTYWTHDLAGTSTSLDDLTDLTIIGHFSITSNPAMSAGFNIPTILNCVWDTTNDTGFSFKFNNFSKIINNYRIILSTLTKC